jgi:hypothetical protein
MRLTIVGVNVTVVVDVRDCKLTFSPFSGVRQSLWLAMRSHSLESRDCKPTFSPFSGVRQSLWLAM